jgi:hypothetical protein
MFGQKKMKGVKQHVDRIATAIFCERRHAQQFGRGVFDRVAD